jgi:hypothetical protein
MGTKAKATVTIEIDCKSSWSNDTTVAQVKKQAVDDARGALRRWAADDSPIRIIGDIDIKIVAFDA